jgi:hypothetical protein
MTWLPWIQAAFLVTLVAAVGWLGVLAWVSDRD